MKIDRAEVLRYMRMGATQPEPALSARIDEIEKQIAAKCRPSAIWRLEKVTYHSDGSFNIGDLACRSEKLLKTIEGCNHAFLFCGTIGADVDAFIRRCALVSGLDALIAQAVSTSLIESFCDDCEEKMALEVPGEKLRMRFSPGYGDLPLSLQKELLAILDTPRKCGVILSEKLLMIPSKSVSAIIGAHKSTE